MAGIQVAIRCRPFTIDDKLGVDMRQNSMDPPDGEVTLLNGSYTTNRFGFSYSWWSAYGFKNHCKSDMDTAEDMTLVHQGMAYEAVGTKIKNDLLGGSAVVIFAYGLSGSGKTFTVFGPDAADSPDAWFKHEEPTNMWGIFPNLAYIVLNKDKQDGWKIKMKYFQNVVDIVRDLMSPTGEEKMYKEGMRKDDDGFMDIQWCGMQFLKDWDELRATFQVANGRKAISPTQFNHQSTRGHCIMTLEVEKPNDEDSSRKDRGRLYVCDLAGTEPAGDIYSAVYKKIKQPDGSVEHQLQGPNPNQALTKELQDQGKKINLSLTEMAQFFMKMAQAVLKKKLKPGQTIPGCNTFFLCKFLKDTCVSAKTYLFCAIRPEVKYHKYTYATLGFAKNASVIKLSPKKATTAMSKAEKKLMAELDKMKEMMQALMGENENLKKNADGSVTVIHDGGGGGDSEAMAKMQAALAEKQSAMEKLLQAQDGDSAGQAAKEAELIKEKGEYEKRGIHLTHFSKDTDFPHFTNIDPDPFQTERFMYIFENDVTKIGQKGDIRPLALTVARDHCSVEKRGEEIFLIGAKGDTYHNGKRITKGKEVKLNQNDRIVLGGELFMFELPNGDTSDRKSPEDAIEEYMDALEAEDGTPSRKVSKKGEGGWVAVESEVRDLLPKTKELKKLVAMLDRGMLSFDVTTAVSVGGDGTPTVKVRITNSTTDENIWLDTFEFLKAFSVIKSEYSKVALAVDGGTEYNLPEAHDPIEILFSNTFQVGSARMFPEFMIYMLPTDQEEMQNEILDVVSGAVGSQHNAGKLEVTWAPMASPDNDNPDDVPYIEDPKELIGKPWHFKCKIKGLEALLVNARACYVQYEFFKENFNTPTLEIAEGSYSPKFEATDENDASYEMVHSIDSVTQEFVDYLGSAAIEFKVFVSPKIVKPSTVVGTTNAQIVQNIKTGSAPESGGGGGGGGDKLESLEAENKKLKAETKRLKKEVQRWQVQALREGIRSKKAGNESEVCTLS